MVIFIPDYDDDDNYDYIGAEYRASRNQHVSTIDSGIVANPYYEGSNNMVTGNTNSGNEGHGHETETITVTKNLYYE